MQQETQVAALVDRGAALLKAGRLSEAASAYAQAAQLESGASSPQLGLTEANFALGETNAALAAAARTQALAPGSADALLAQAIAQAISGQYETALATVEQSIALEPARPYAHALRGYCLRRLGQRYEGALADARAARGWGDRDFDHLFPKPATAAAVVAAPALPPNPYTTSPTPRAPRPWDQRSQMSRRATQVRFATRNIPIVTYTLIAINVAVYLLGALFARNLFAPAPFTPSGAYIPGINPVYDYGMEAGALIQQNPLQAYRIFTAMFVHEGIAHIGLNMLSLYFVGVITEQIFGKRRFLAIYLATGIIAGIAQAIITPNTLSFGASGAIFGIFGAFGAFALLRRRAFGAAGNAIIGQWVFWLVINLVFSVSDPQVALFDHLGGLISGFVLGWIIVSTVRPRRGTAPGM